MKAASHELNWLASVQGVGASKGGTRLCVPFMVLVDDLGFRYLYTQVFLQTVMYHSRLICVSILPIDTTTIAYGSNDGGRTMHKRDKKLNKLMNQVSNLGAVRDWPTPGVFERTFVFPGGLG